ncbi:MAG: hypothetical protein RIF41_28710, partial [Polyangiaceae bacterium]
EGIGGTPWALALVIALHLGVFVAPYVALVLAMAGLDQLLWPALAGVGTNVALRAVLSLRFGQPLEGIALHPLSILALCAIAFNSYRWTSLGRLTWAGRTYGPRKDRRVVTS